jgi:cell wall-associated NlpC family hydrolase
MSLNGRSCFPWLLTVAFVLAGCATTSSTVRYSLDSGNTSVLDAASDASASEDEEAETNDSEAATATDGWLQALSYRSPNYQLTLPNHPRNLLSEALKKALSLKGTPYRYGGTSRKGLDCSGLVWVTFSSVGIELPRTSYAQFRATKPIPRDQLQPGDLVFFKTGRSKWRKVDHVGIYVGGGTFLHAPRRGKRVGFASLDNPYWKKRFKGAGRIPELELSQRLAEAATLPQNRLRE